MLDYARVINFLLILIIIIMHVKLLDTDTNASLLKQFMHIHT